MLRQDLQQISQWVTAQSHVLDLGCGNGELLHFLTAEKNCTGYGIELDIERVISSMSRGINVINADLEEGLTQFDDNSFDVIVLSQTIQAMKNTETILNEMMRVANEAIVSFPNFGYWHNRVQIALAGHMPVSENMPYQWYNTPNIHWCTLQDFNRLCEKNKIKIIESVVMTEGKAINFCPNLLGSLAVYRIGRA